MKKKLTIVMLTIGFVFLGFKIKNQRSTDADKTSNAIVKPLFKIDSITAGEPVVLKFTSNKNEYLHLHCSHSYGDILLEPEIKNDEAVFNLPKPFTSKSGMLSWSLVLESKTILNGKISVLPKDKIHTVESYVGPPSIEAGGTDYTMFTVIPSDSLDNPLADNTRVVIKHQFVDIYKTDVVFTRYGYTFKNIYSYPEAGRIIMNSESLGLNSKEFDVNVAPAIPTNFKISYSRIHDYADGNQITTFKTNIIKDRFNNIVSDGTMVTFFITNKFGHRSITNGPTIRGVAHAYIVHPDFEDYWSVKAYVEGMAESDTINLNFQKAIDNIKVNFENKNRKIKIGPVRSFMNQRVPEGLSITLKIYKDNLLEEKIIKETTNGYTHFILKKDRFPKGIYTLEIYAAGTTQVFKDIELNNE